MHEYSSEDGGGGAGGHEVQKYRGEEGAGVAENRECRSTSVKTVQ